jgi:transcriptional regulator with XRE-family HTH domain
MAEPSSVHAIYHENCGINKIMVDIVDFGMDFSRLAPLDCRHYRGSKRMVNPEARLGLGVAESANSGVGRFSELGARITRLRTEKGWERPVLARKLRVSRDRLYKWERGENAPPLEILVLLATLLEVTVDELVTGRPWAGDGVSGVLRALDPVEPVRAQGRRGEMEDFLAAAVEMLRRFRRDPLLAFDDLLRALDRPGVDLDG